MLLTKSELDEIQNYLLDASNIGGGAATSVFFPETVEQIAELLREATANKTPVTVSGAGTGTVGGRVPFAGAVLSLEKLNKIKRIELTANGGRATVEPAVLLQDLNRAVAEQKLFYPPDPTEWSCQIGGTIATNASGARSFKYGSTREFVERLQIVLPTGDVLNLRRNEIFAGADNKLRLPISKDKTLEVPLPTYKMPATRKHAAGYFYKPGMDAIDLFIGSEGTLGVVTEIELRLLAAPENFLSGVIFFQNETNLLDFVDEARALSFATRAAQAANRENSGLDAAKLDYIDNRALDIMRTKFAETPAGMAGAIVFEQETTAANEDGLFERWAEIFERHNADLEQSWFATNDADANRIREFRHAAPVAINEWIVRHKQRKVSTDMAVSDREFPQMLRFYRETLDASSLNYVIFGHIGDNHLHVNILPRDATEAITAKHIYGRFIARALIIGGTISAEHGIGKLKKQYLNAMFGERFLSEMAAVKKALDPAGILGRGIMLDEKYLS